MTFAFCFFSLFRDYLTEHADWTTGAFVSVRFFIPVGMLTIRLVTIRIRQLSPWVQRKALARIASPSPCVIVGQRQLNTIPASLWPMDSMVPLMSFFFGWVEWSGFHQGWISSKSFKTSLSSNKNTRAPGGLPGGLFFEKSSSNKNSCLPCWVFPGQKLKLLATLTLTEVPLVRLCDPGFWALAFGQWVPNATEYHRAEAACGLRFWRSGGWWVRWVRWVGG